jgi:hypothetical protein
MIGDVEFDHMGVATFSVNLRPQVFQFFNAATGQHHRGTGCRQGAGKLGAQTAGSACDKSHPAR